MVFIPPAPYLPGQGQFLPTYSLGVPSIRGLGNCTLLLPLNTSGCCQGQACHHPAGPPELRLCLYMQTVSKKLPPQLGKRSYICVIDSSGLMSLCVEEVSRFISDMYVQQWVCGPPQRLVV